VEQLLFDYFVTLSNLHLMHLFQQLFLVAVEALSFLQLDRQLLIKHFLELLLELFLHLFLHLLLHLVLNVLDRCNLVLLELFRVAPALGKQVLRLVELLLLAG
jgi:hypothetical protein